MSLLTDLGQRLRAWVFRAREERELEEELRFHLERDAEERARKGSPDPWREAKAALGGLERVKEEVREARGLYPLEDFIADTRYALRALRRNPGFTLAVVAVLGLALGAATAVFAVVHGVLLAGLPYPTPHQLVRVYQQFGPRNLGTLSVVDVQAILRQQRTFQAFGVVRPSSASLAGAGSPEWVPIGRATSGFFQALEVRAAYGRLLEERDDVPGAAPVVVVSSAYAAQALGEPAWAVGKAITLDGVSHAVVGVLEPGRDELAGIHAGVWPVLQLGTPNRRGPFGLRGIGRLQDGVTLEQAASDLADISRRIFPIWASSFQNREARLTPVPLRQAIVGYAEGQVGLFAGAVALVLLVAIANVATLLLVRASTREHELSVRAALGAGRSRLTRLLVAECVALIVLAGLAGLAVAALAIRAVGLVAPNVPRVAEVALDGPTLAFAAATCLLTGLAVSLAPVSSVLRTRAPVSRGLVSSSRGASPGRRGTGLRGALVVTEFALVLPLLLGAGLLFNSFLRLQRVDPGFDPRGLYGVQVSLPPARYPDAAAVQGFWGRAQARAAEGPGVSAVGLASFLPPDNYGDVNNFDLLDRPVPDGATQPVAPWATVTGEFFAALGIPLLEGRWFTAGDSAAAPPVVLVSRAWATTYYPEGGAVGKRLYSGGCTSCTPTTVIGVVGDVHYRGLAGAGDAVYSPLAQGPARTMVLLARSNADGPATLRALRGVVAGLDPELAPVDVVMSQRLQDALGDPRRWASVVGAFAAAGALLAALGIFGLMSYVVWQRRRELGVRVALGAEPASLRSLVVRRGMRYALLGTAIGVGISAFETRWLGSLLFGVGATDPLTVATASTVLLVMALAACWIPAVRAARVRPGQVLAAE